MALTIKKADKDERLTIRLPAKDKFALELLSRASGKTYSTLFMESLRQMLDSPEWQPSHLKDKSESHTLKGVAELAWSPLEIDRTIQLAMIAPHLLNGWERVLWTVVNEDTSLLDEDGKPSLPAIRDQWKQINTKVNKLLETE